MILVWESWSLKLISVAWYRRTKLEKKMKKKSGKLRKNMGEWGKTWKEFLFCPPGIESLAMPLADFVSFWFWFSLFFFLHFAEVMRNFRFFFFCFLWYFLLFLHFLCCSLTCLLICNFPLKLKLCAWGRHSLVSFAWVKLH